MAINLSELQSLLDSAQTSAANEKEVRKSLTRVENLMANVTQEIQHIYQLLDGVVEAKKPRKQHEPVETDPEAPYGRKKDGTPKSKPGRSK
jgi:hypothetical protein